jgi:hypothetical protein
MSYDETAKRVPMKSTETKGIKQTGPMIKKSAIGSDMNQVGKDSAAAAKKYQHAAKPWKSKGIPAKSKVASSGDTYQDSRPVDPARVATGPGYDNRGDGPGTTPKEPGYRKV